jgi:hypothetical protein
MYFIMINLEEVDQFLLISSKINVNLCSNFLQLQRATNVEIFIKQKEEKETKLPCLSLFLLKSS